MRRSIFADANRVVGKNKDRWTLHQRSQPNAGPHVIAEVKESRTERSNSRNRQPVHAGPHHVLTNSEVQIASRGSGGLKIARAFELERGLVRSRQIGRSANQPRNVLRQRIEHFTRTLAGRNTLGIGGKCREVIVPACRQFVVLHLAETLGTIRIFLRVCREKVRPLRMQIAPAFPDPFAKMFSYAVRHQELCILRPTVKLLDQSHFFFAQGLAVRRVGVLFMRRTVADVAIHDDQGGPVCGLVERVERARQHRQVIGIGHARYVPSISHKASRNVLAERPIRRTIEGNVIVVIHPTEI